VAVRERRREKEKKKEKPKEVEKPSEVEKETTVAVEVKPDVEVEKQQATQVEVKETPETTAETEVAEIVEPKLLLPKWGDIDESEWMYSIPPRDEDKDLWAEEWSDFLLRWMEEHNVHIVSVTTFIGEVPFKDMSNKVVAFRLIAEDLIEKRVAEWRDKRKRQLRVYWRPLEDWMDILYQWAIESGTLRLDVKSLIIQQNDRTFSKLPERDLHIVLNLMVEKEMAQWVDKEKGAVKVTL
jgi:hypothetical protein